MTTTSVLVASRGGADTHPSWYLNLLAHPEITIHVGPDHIPATARTAEGPERQRLWPLMVEALPRFAEYQANTKRIRPVVILKPINYRTVTHPKGRPS